MDVFDKCSEYSRSSLAREAGVYTYFREITSAQDPVVTHDKRDLIIAKALLKEIE